MKKHSVLTILLSFSVPASTFAEKSDFRFNDPEPKRYTFEERASKIDPRVKAHPEINFLIQSKDGKPADLQQAAVDTSVAPLGKLVIWLMGNNDALFQRLNRYGLHAIRPHYANKWFGIVCQEKPVGPHCRGNVRLEAATGEDFSDQVDIPKPDGMMERSFQFVKWLDREHPEGNWSYFLNDRGDGLRWTDVIVAGSSHGSTTATRFSKHVEVSRVVALCGPRDQHQQWQSLPSATPSQRIFGFSHVLDGGWAGDHYCRSWEMLGLHEYGRIVNVDETPSPFENSRRLITDFDVKGDAKRAHSAVTPGRASAKDTRGKFLHEKVWEYMFTHPVDQVGTPVPMDKDCDKVQAK